MTMHIVIILLVFIVFSFLISVEHIVNSLFPMSNPIHVHVHINHLVDDLFLQLGRKNVLESDMVRVSARPIVQ
jgi:hypothetical protein